MTFIFLGNGSSNFSFPVTKKHFVGDNIGVSHGSRCNINWCLSDSLNSQVLSNIITVSTATIG